MQNYIAEVFGSFPLPLLIIVIAVTLTVLAKGADLLVDEAVSLSVRLRIPAVVIGATIVSIGTTMPEAAVSVMAAVSGNSGLAMGNAVGSIICNTALILGLSSIIGPVQIDRGIVKRQLFIMLGVSLLLIFSAIPYASLSRTFSEGGTVPRFMGFVILALLVVYLWDSIRWSRKSSSGSGSSDSETVVHADSSALPLVFFKLLLGIVLVIISSRLLIPAVEITALRLGIPDAIIAATLVAFGTSLPELVTAITAVRKGHSSLGVGNIIGANILNILFVVGAAAAVTPGGLAAPESFFTLYFPAMLWVYLLFGIGFVISRKRFSPLIGVLLLLSYAVSIVAGFSVTVS